MRWGCETNAAFINILVVLMYRLCVIFSKANFTLISDGDYDATTTILVIANKEEHSFGAKLCNFIIWGFESVVI